MAGNDGARSASDVQLARYEFKRALEELQQARGRGTELVTVYVPASKPISDAAGYLRQEFGQAANIKSSSTRKNVQGAISSLLAELKRFPVVAPASGIAMFVGHKAVGNNKTRLVKHVLLPPEPVNSFLYRCDSEFFLEPLQGMLTEPNVYGLLVVDRQEATIGILRGERIEVKKHSESMVPRKHRMGGQSQARIARVIEEQADDFFKKVCEDASRIFLHEEGLKGVLVGGPGYTKRYVVDQEWLQYEIQKKVINTFDVGYTDEAGLYELVNAAQENLRQLGMMRERDLLGKFMQRIAKDASLVTYGESFVRQALEMGAVETLLLSEQLRKSRAKVVCETCQHTEEHTTQNLDQLAESLGACPACGKDTLEISEHKDIIEELSELASQTGGAVELLTDATEEGKQFFKSFGGIGALLRFKVSA